ncbi:MAG TPA: cytochrome P450 [Anaerolineae bacterium]
MTTAAVAPQPIEEAPYYRGSHWLLGSVREISGDPLALFEKLLPRYPDIVRTRLGRVPAYIVFNADYARHVLQRNHENYTRPNLFSRLLHAVAGENLFSSEGAYWQRQRKVLSPAFHRQRIIGFGRIMAEETEQMLQRWQDQPQPLDVQAEMTKLTLNIVGRSLFSVDMLAENRGRELTQGFEGTTSWINYRFKRPFAPLWLPTRANRDFRQAQATVQRVVRQILAERRRQGGEHYDLLQMLLDLRYEDSGEGLDDLQIINEMGTFFFAGHETTANTLTWTFYLLSQHPEIEGKLHAELAQVLGGRTPTVDDLPELPYTRMVIQEAMRLYPAAWAVTRQPIADDQVGPYQLAAGSTVFLAFYGIHRHPRYWDNVNAFDPERFTPERSANRPSHAYLPFGTGPRFCIGSQFAMTEAPIALATIAQHFRLRLVKGTQVEPEMVFTLRVKDQLPMTLESRSG